MTDELAQVGALRGRVDRFRSLQETTTDHIKALQRANAWVGQRAADIAGGRH